MEFLNKITTILRVKVERIKEIENLMSNELDNLNKIVIFSASVSKLRINEIKKVINILRQNNVEIAGSVFFKSVKETEKIITVCKKNKIKITPTVFLKSANKLQETIKFLKNNYSDEFLKPLIINKDKKYLEKVFLYLESLGVLHVVINSSSILTLTLDEIIERKDFLESIGEDLVVKNKFNSIFGLSRNKYQKRKKYFLKKI